MDLLSFREMRMQGNASAYEQGAVQLQAQTGSLEGALLSHLIRCAFISALVKMLNCGGDVCFEEVHEGHNTQMF